MGVCVLDLYKDPESARETHWAPLKGVRIDVKEFTTVDGEEAILDYLDDMLHRAVMLHKSPVIHVTCEHFVFTRVSAMGGSRAAVEMTGALKALVRLERNRKNPRVKLYFDDTQKPADAKLVDTKTLELLGIKVRGDKSTDHAHMAAKHALVKSSKIRKQKGIR